MGVIRWNRARSGAIPANPREINLDPDTTQPVPAEQRINQPARFAIRASVGCSALATVLILAACVASQFRSYTVHRMVVTLSPTGSVNHRSLPRTTSRGLILDRHRGELVYAESIGDPGPAQPPSTRFSANPVVRNWLGGAPPAPTRLRFLDISFNHEHLVTPGNLPKNIQTRIMTRTMVYLPWWFLAGLAAWPALVWIAQRVWKRADRRQARGLCRKCAYNIAGITADVCPECGWPVPPKPGPS